MVITTSRLIAAVPATALALGLACAPAWAEGSDGMGMEALVAAIPRDAAGWSNGPASLLPQGGGEYWLEHDTAFAHGSAGMPGVAVIVGNEDGNPVTARLPAPARATGFAGRTGR